MFLLRCSSPSEELAEGDTGLAKKVADGGPRGREFVTYLHFQDVRGEGCESEDLVHGGREGEREREGWVREGRDGEREEGRCRGRGGMERGRKEDVEGGREGGSLVVSSEWTISAAS